LNRILTRKDKPTMWKRRGRIRKCWIYFPNKTFLKTSLTH